MQSEIESTKRTYDERHPASFLRRNLRFRKPTPTKPIPGVIIDSASLTKKAVTTAEKVKEKRQKKINGRRSQKNKKLSSPKLIKPSNISKTDLVNGMCFFSYRLPLLE